MKAVYVEPVKTPLTFEDALVRLRQGIHVATGDKPSDAALALALGKTALETGRWQSMWNWNWGNVKSGDTYEGMYTCFACNEVLNGRVVWFAPEGQLTARGGEVTGLAWSVPPGHPMTRFRAYANGYDGAQQYVDFVANGRYRDAWARLLDGDPAGYVHELRKKGYFTADEATYLKGVEALYREFLSKVETFQRNERAQQDTIDDEGGAHPTDPSPPPSEPPESVA